LGVTPDEGDYFVPVEIAHKLERERDEARETAERYRLDANRFEAEVMMLKEELKVIKN
jgi:hypothetical protein